MRWNLEWSEFKMFAVNSPLQIDSNVTFVTERNIYINARVAILYQYSSKQRHCKNLNHSNMTLGLWLLLLKASTNWEERGKKQQWQNYGTLMEVNDKSSVKHNWTDDLSFTFTGFKHDSTIATPDCRH
jgi:hypothetical protein